MFAVPEKIKGITHPLIADMYLKKDIKNKNVLVISAHSHEEIDDHEDYDSYLIDLLSDLDVLKSKLEEQNNYFDRIEIRTH